MRCDIHLFVEYKTRGEGRWTNFAGRMNLDRDYVLFGALAGVRCEGPPVVKPRGFPTDAGWVTRDEYAICIMETQVEADNWREGGMQACSREVAEPWLASGWSRWLEGPHPAKYGMIGRISDPDTHTATWLTLEEFRKAIQQQEPQAGTEYRAVLAAMESLAADGCLVRAVFWFDN